MNRGVRVAVTWIVLMFFCSSLLAQAKFNGQIQPGLSTRSDVEKALGAPVKQDNAALFDYKPLQGAKSLQIGYRADGVVFLIRAEFTQPYSRDVMRQALRLPEKSQGTRTSQGILAEYFGAPAYIVLGYASTSPASGVTILVYCSADEFQKIAPPSGGVQPQPMAPSPAPSIPPTLNTPGPQNQTQPSSPAAGVPLGCLKDVTVNLVTPISSQTSRPGETIQAQAIAPVGVQGDVVTGTIHQISCEAGDKGVLACVLNFSFDALAHKGQMIPMKSQMVSLANSKSWPHVDEEGDVVTQRGNYVDVITRREIAASLGGSVPGPRPSVYIQLTTNAAKLSFAPGTQFKVVLHSDTPTIPELQCEPKKQ